jgi:outer membrane protein
MFPMPLLLVMLFAITALAQPQLSLPDAVQQAATQYPTTAVAQAGVDEAAAAVRLARTSFLPRTQFMSQVNRATRNNIFGMLLPQQVIAPISGPPRTENDMTNVWGTATGWLVSWQPFDFGFRKAQVATASAEQRRAELARSRTAFENASTAADSYLSVVAAEQSLARAEAGLARLRALEETVTALVRAELRPGLDLTSTRADRARTELQIVQARQAVAIARATLAQMVGQKAFALRHGALLGAPPAALFSTGNLSEHPALREQQASVDISQARQQELARAWFPRIETQSALYARGSGAFPDGRTGGAFSGLGPNIVNWGAGLTMTFDPLSLKGIRIEREMETHRERAERQRYELLMRELNGQLDRARALLEGARAAAATAPGLLDAARSVQQQTIARYKAGLSTLVEVAEAERAFTEAEIDDRLSQLSVWRALLSVAIAQGNLDPFLALLGETKTP